MTATTNKRITDAEKQAKAYSANEENDKKTPSYARRSRAMEQPLKNNNVINVDSNRIQVQEAITKSLSENFGKRIRESVPGYCRWLLLVALMIIAAFATFDYAGAQDSDQWWLLATGEYIINNGIPQMNPWSVFDDQHIVIQQWIPAVLTFASYSAFGYIGFGIVVLIMTALLTTCSLGLVMTVSDKRPSELSFFAIAMMIGACSAYLSIRPQAWSMVFFIQIMIILEKYRRTNNKKFLILLPIIVAIHANFHLSMMPFDLIIVACYIIPSIKTKRIATGISNYSRVPLLVSFFFMLLATLLNPYGLDGALYLFNSYGSAAYGNYIAEMGTIAPADSYYGTLMVIMLVLGTIAIGKNGAKQIDLPLTLLFLLTAVLSFQHVRNVWLVAVFALPLFASSMRGVCLSPRVVFFRDDMAKIGVSALGVVTVLISGIIMGTQELSEEPQDNATTPIIAVQWLDSNASKNAKVFTHFNAGGYLEWNGYKVGMDARPELWNSSISKNGADRYNEYIDMTKNKVSVASYLDGKDFDFAIVNDNTKIQTYLNGSSEWVLATKGEGYSLYQKAL